MRSRMRATVLAGLGGFVNVAVLFLLFTHGAYPFLDALGSIAATLVPGFALGFVVVFLTVRTGVVLPTIVFLATLVGTAFVELWTPAPTWTEMNGYVIVEGPHYVSSYAHTWYVWLALGLFGGVVEFAIREGYGLGDGRLRNLPTLPLDRRWIAGAVTAMAVVLGLATAFLTLRSGMRPAIGVVVIFVVAAAAASVPLAALLLQGALLPTALFAVFVPYMLAVEVFVTTDSPVHILLFGPFAILLAVVWLLEMQARRRLTGWEGGDFAGGVTE